LLTIAEQMPGMFVTRDMTATLQDAGYWASFNIPYFRLTWILLGYEECTGPYGAYDCGYAQNFRNLLFESLQGGVVDLPSFQAVLMYNEWQSNPLQKGANYSIAARYDLLPAEQDPIAYGGIDGKVTLDSWMKDASLPLRVSAVSGPTKDAQPPFCWTGQWAAQQPLGQPTCYDFPWVQYSAAGEQADNNDVIAEE
jgi:hypothetical protein